MSSSRDGMHLYPAASTGQTQGNTHAQESPSAFALLILDTQGQIVFCSPDAPQLLDCVDKTPIGRSIAEFIPALPLQQNTSGCNLEYIGFWAHGDQWQFDA